ncbi:hypothetical protein GCM10023091_00400 [Ravibacter arvi]|uniref:Thiopeptide-type bacteriocin biosynthesis protein n=1 Tax=Ravibacter arvi TaxID=2051041 RepID=A0ABP8LKE6_9BACT
MQDYLDCLIENNILYSSIDPNVTGEEFFDSLFREIFRISEIEPSVVSIRESFALIAKHIEVIKLGKGEMSSYFAVKSIVDSIIPDFKYSESRLFQMDTFGVSNDLSLSAGAISDILDVVSDLNALNTDLHENVYMERFKRNFTHIYELQSVRLVDVLDSETGIGYRTASELSNLRSNMENIDDGSLLERLSFAKYLDFIKSGSSEIVIKQEDIKMARVPNPLPNAFTIFVNFLGSNNKAEYNISGVNLSNTKLFGRFCHGSPDLYDKIKAISEEEESDDYINAEIAHLPQSRIGNVVSRPELTKYEIEFLSLSKVKSDFKIMLNDLYVRVQNGEIILFSKKLKKRVIPKLTNAHNYATNSLDIYHFLSDLQYQNVKPVSIWKWGKLMNSEAYLPRVIYKNCIVSRARWRIYLADFVNVPKGFSFFIRAFREVKNSRDIPRLVTIAEGDNQLVLDLTVDLCLEILKKNLEKYRQIDLHEFVFAAETGLNSGSALQNYEGNYFANEILIPVKQSGENKAIAKFDNSWLNSLGAKRTFYLGSEWLYLKIYCKPKHFDEILAALARDVNLLLKNGSVETWFFIKYADPLPHIRLRFKVGSEIGCVLEKVYFRLKKFIDKNYLRDICSGTYRREIERYGKKSIGLSEHLFQLNSCFVCELIRQFRKVNNSADIFLLSIYVVDKTLDIMKIDKTEKFSFLKFYFEKFALEFSYQRDKAVRKELSNLYRAQKDQLQDNFGFYMLSIAQRKIVNNYLMGVENLIKLSDCADMKSWQFVGSHIHMFINRLFTQKPRLIEFRMYFFLFSYYKSVVAKSQKVIVSEYTNSIQF